MFQIKFLCKRYQLSCAYSSKFRQFMSKVNEEDLITLSLTTSLFFSDPKLGNDFQLFETKRH